LVFKRAITLPAPGTTTFFLWGPRQAGKTTLLRATYPDALWIDLLKADEFRRYLQNPEVLRELLAARASVRQVVIDEVQKVPQLLDEVHWIHENRRVRFALCGSSARKVKRGQANLLGGRAIRYELHGLTAAEIGREFDLNRMLNHGYLPSIYQSTHSRPLLNAYVADYLKEEIAAEGLVRNLPVYSEFLNMAALADAELVNFSTIARDCGVSSHTIKGYFQILEDTLLGRWLPAYTRRPKRRVIAAPKFYFGDVGVVNYLARRGNLEPASELYGKAFENWVFHELCARNAYSQAFANLACWRLPSGIEVDFIVNDMAVGIEAKATPKVTADHLRGLREVVRDHPRMKQRIIVSLERASRKTDDGIWILPAKEFADRLSIGDFF
jgi:predicted AAA+ superfamily ATPase